MKVSVIIPCYNASEYLDKCLGALERQTFKDFEVVCINDCSTDATEDVILRWQRESSFSVVYLKNEINSGPAKSRNNGIANAKGDFVCFCDSDDWYEDNYIEKMVAAQQINDADLVFCGYQLVSTGGVCIHHQCRLDKNQLAHKESLLTRGVDSLWAMMIRRIIIAHVPQPDIRTAEDMAVIPVLIAESSRFACVPECIYNYFSRKGSVSMSPTQNDGLNALISFKFIKDRLSEEYYDEVEFLGARNSIYGSLLTIFSHGYNTKQADFVLDSFEKYCPDWGRNPYIKELPLFKRIFLAVAARRHYLVIRILCRIHYAITTA